MFFRQERCSGFVLNGTKQGPRLSSLLQCKLVWGRVKILSEPELSGVGGWPMLLATATRLCAPGVVLAVGGGAQGGGEQKVSAIPCLGVDVKKKTSQPLIPFLSRLRRCLTHGA